MLRHIAAYDWPLKVFARRPGTRMSQAEALLWNELKRRRMLGYSFERKRAVDRYLADFYCEELRFDIEIDAVSGTKVSERERERDIRLRLSGHIVLRFTDEEVMHNLDGVLTGIRQSIRNRPWK